MTAVEVRTEAPGDPPAIDGVHRRAFDGPEEATLVDDLRGSPAFVPELSLVASRDGAVVGHVLFSEVGVDASPPGTPLAALVLAPLAVDPDHQGRGIGSELVRIGLDRAHDLGYDLVVLHGSREFYGRFGFRPAVPAGIENPLDLPDPDFQACELTAGALDHAGDGSAVTYPPPFDRL